uniref:Uncharacterized protein n=2 Tax=Brassica campestris TaxID=3711 RepID=M4EQ57_BRACM
MGKKGKKDGGLVVVKPTKTKKRRNEPVDVSGCADLCCCFGGGGGGGDGGGGGYGGGGCGGGGGGG